MSAPDTSGAAPPTARSRLLAWWRNLTRPVQAVAAVAGSVAAILGLVFLLWPDARPDPTPDEATVEFTRFAVDYPFTRGASLDRRNLPRVGFTKEQLAERGAFFSFDLEVDGYGGRALPVRWLLLDASGNLAASQNRRVSLRPDRNAVTLSHGDWAPVPEEGGPFRVVVEVYPPGTAPEDRDRSPLRTRESDPFGGG